MIKSLSENRLFCVWVYPGQNTPEIPLHVAAAAMKKIGRFERFASARAVSHVVYQATPDSPMGWGLAPRSVGRGPCPRAIPPNKTIQRKTSSFTGI